MQLDRREEGAVLVLTAREKRIDARSASGFKQQLQEFVGAGHVRIVLNLADVEFVDSTGLGAMVSGLRMIGDRGDLALAQPRETVQSLLRLTRLDKVFRIFPAEDAAVAALAA